MNRPRKYRNIVTSVLGTLSLWITSGSSAPLQAAQTTTDIAVSITADRDAARPGQDITYTVTTTNLGPDNATFVDVALDISDQLQIVSITCDYGISPDGPFCEYSSLDAGASAISTFVVTPKATASARSRTVQTSASILFENIDAFDPDTTNNTASVETRLIGRLGHP